MYAYSMVTYAGSFMAVFRGFHLKRGFVISLFLSSLRYDVIQTQKTSTDDSEPTCSSRGSQGEQLTNEVNELKLYMIKVFQQLDRIEKELHPRDCYDLLLLGRKSNGVYTVYLGDVHRPVDVYCDMTTDGGGWTVFQRRQDGSVDFYRNWSNYSNGFGSLTGEFWLGNDNIRSLTANRKYELRVDLADFSNNTRYVKYSNFTVGGAADKYRLKIGTYSGNGGDSLSWSHDGRRFSTFDQDNDLYVEGSCVELYRGGWWYSACHSSNLNGLYLRGNHTSYANGVEWDSWTGQHYSLKFTEMKIRPADI